MVGDHPHACNVHNRIMVGESGEELPQPRFRAQRGGERGHRGDSGTFGDVGDPAGDDDAPINEHMDRVGQLRHLCEQVRCEQHAYAVGG